MPKKLKTTRRAVLRLPDLDYSKSAVLNTLRSPGSRRAYEFALNEFIAWYCSEPRLAFNRVVVVRYPLALEARGLAASSINQRLAAVRRLAYEAADCGTERHGVKPQGCHWRSRSCHNQLAWRALSPIPSPV